jgi:ribokinase
MDVVVRAARFPRVGETVSGTEVHFFPGGKGANQAVAAAKLGAPTALIGRIGDDAFGRELHAFLAGQRVDLKHVAVATKTPTGTAIVTVSDTNNTIVVVPGANGLVDVSDVSAPTVKEGDILVSQFEIPVSAIEAFFLRGRAARARTILNPAPVVEFDRSLLELVDIIVLNETELGILSGADLTEVDTPAKIIEHAHALQRSRDQIVCVTLGKRGAIALAGKESIEIPGRGVAVTDTTGAGDCFVGAFAARLSAGADIHSALQCANVAASISVQRMGAGPSMPTGAELASEMGLS